MPLSVCNTVRTYIFEIEAILAKHLPPGLYLFRKRIADGGPTDTISYFSLCGKESGISNAILFLPLHRADWAALS